MVGRYLTPQLSCERIECNASAASFQKIARQFSGRWAADASMPIGGPVERRGMRGDTTSAWKRWRHRAHRVVDLIRLAADERDFVALEPEDEDRSRRHELLREHLDRQSML